jgi:endonuclease YncB( thermonuclease family)
MQTNRSSTLGIVAAIALAGCSRSPTLFADNPVEPKGSVVVQQGDALVVDGRPVRLANAATPQLAPNAHCWAEALAGRQARDTVQNLVAVAADVSASSTGAVDQEGRTLSRVTVDGADLGQTLLDQGLAVAPSKEPFDWCAPLSTNLAEGPRLSALASASK